MTTAIRLNVGAGSTEIPGFTPIDIKNGTDITDGLPYKDGEVDEIYCSHTLEHIHHSKTDQIIAEFRRVLRPGGRLRLAVPDWGKIEKARADGLMSHEMYMCWLYGSNDDPNDRHQSVFTEDSLGTLLTRHGFDDIGPWDAEYNDCSSLPQSLNIEGVKRQFVIKDNPKVAMILSTPRVGFTDFYQDVTRAAVALGWNLITMQGTEWGKALTDAVKQAIATTDCDYIMTLDYDSAFVADDCRKLLKHMQENPDYAALFPVQAHRHQDCPLGFSPILVTRYTADPVQQMISGHFGCTIIRREVFEIMPAPWFLTLPNPETFEIGKGSVDADIYFWIQLAQYGMKAGQANDVQIGHMELCVKWMVGDKIAWQPIGHYRQKGRPPNAVLDGPKFSERILKAREAEIAEGRARDAEAAKQAKSETVQSLDAAGV